MMKNTKDICNYTVITHELNTERKIQFNFNSFNDANQYYKSEINLSTENHTIMSGSTQIQLLKNNHQLKEIIISSYININKTHND